jgi:hypothetical protein
MSDPFVNRPRIGVNLDEMVRSLAANIEDVGERNRRELADRPKRYDKNEHYYCVARRFANGQVWIETLEDVSPQPLEDDVGHREIVKLGKLSASGPSEAGAIANLHFRYAQELFRRKVVDFDRAREWSANVRFTIAEWLG